MVMDSHEKHLGIVSSLPNLGEISKVHLLGNGNSKLYKATYKTSQGKFNVAVTRNSLQNWIRPSSLYDHLKKNYRELNILKTLRDNNPRYHTLIRQFHDAYAMHYDTNNFSNFSVFIVEANFNTSLQSIRAKLWSYSSDDIRYIMNRIVLGLNYIHDLRIIHGQIHSRNILIDWQNGKKVVISNFSQARFESDSEDEPLELPMFDQVGLPHMYPPEKYYTGSKTTQAWDLWHLGLVFLEMISTIDHQLLLKSSHWEKYYKKRQTTTLKMNDYLMSLLHYRIGPPTAVELTSLLSNRDSRNGHLSNEIQYKTMVKKMGKSRHNRRTFKLIRQLEDQQVIDCIRCQYLHRSSKCIDNDVVKPLLPIITKLLRYSPTKRPSTSNLLYDDFFAIHSLAKNKQPSKYMENKEDVLFRQFQNPIAYSSENYGKRAGEFKHNVSFDNFEQFLENITVNSSVRIYHNSLANDLLISIVKTIHEAVNGIGDDIVSKSTDVFSDETLLSTYLNSKLSALQAGLKCKCVFREDNNIISLQVAPKCAIFKVGHLIIKTSQENTL